MCNTYSLPNNRGYKYYKGHTFLYKVVDGAIKTTTAKMICEAMGGHLANAGDTEKQDILIRWAKLFQFLPGSVTLIALNDGYQIYDSNYIDNIANWNEYAHGYVCEWDEIRTNYDNENNDWLDIRLSFAEETLYGFLSEQTNNFDNSLCYSSNNLKLLMQPFTEWQEISENGSMFFDPTHNSGVILLQNGAKIIGNNLTSLECKGLQQWIAPTGIIGAMSTSAILSSWDNSTIVTLYQQGFHRELLKDKKLELSAVNFSGKKLSIGDTGKNGLKTLHVNSIAELSQFEPIAWQNICELPPLI